MESIQEFVQNHPFFKDLPEAYLDRIVGCTGSAHFYAAQTILKEGEAADKFYIIREGEVVLEVVRSLGTAVPVQKLGPGDVLGWSWLNPPYKWHFDARAVQSSQAVVFDAVRLRKFMEDDPAFGLAFLKRFAELMMQRLNQTRLRLIDRSLYR